jgi:hypothetical protein
MSTKDLAFPQLELNSSTGDVCQQHFGMTLRDYFAAKAMQALLSSTNNVDRIEGYVGFKKISTAAYHCADEMLKTREQ